MSYTKSQLDAIIARDTETQNPNAAKKWTVGELDSMLQVDAPPVMEGGIYSEPQDPFASIAQPPSPMPLPPTAAQPQMQPPAMMPPAPDPIMEFEGAMNTGRYKDALTLAPEAFRKVDGIKRIQDAALSVAKGTIALPEALVGLADIPTGGRIGKFLEDSIGFKPREAKEALTSMQSDEQQQAFQNVHEADGFLDTTAAALQNPSVIAQTVLESAPLMGGGAAIARGLMTAVPRLSGVVAGAIGEGAIGAGSTAEQVRGENPDRLLTPKQSGIAAGSGALTGMLSVFGGRLAQKYGFNDIDTLLTTGASNPAARSGIVRDVVYGAASEGFLEELPQSVQEQVAQNIALGRPLTEGVDEAAALGALSGIVMGGGGQVLARKAPAEQPRKKMSLREKPPKAGDIERHHMLPDATKVIAPEPELQQIETTDSYNPLAEPTKVIQPDPEPPKPRALLEAPRPVLGTDLLRPPKRADIDLAVKQFQSERQVTPNVESETNVQPERGNTAGLPERGRDEAVGGKQEQVAVPETQTGRQRFAKAELDRELSLSHLTDVERKLKKPALPERDRRILEQKRQVYMDDLKPTDIELRRVQALSEENVTPHQRSPELEKAMADQPPMVNIDDLAPEEIKARQDRNAERLRKLSEQKQASTATVPVEKAPAARGGEDPTPPAVTTNELQVTGSADEILARPDMQGAVAAAKAKRSKVEAPAETAKPDVVIADDSPESPDLVPGTRNLIKDIRAKLDTDGFRDNRDLQALAEKHFGGTRGEGKYTPKDAYDALEAAANTWVVENGKELLSTENPQESLKKLREFVKKMPTQTDRTKEQQAFQQFSTPPMHSFIAAKALDFQPGDRVDEPSAGVGGLAAFAKAMGADVHVNEISPRRAALLKELGFTSVSMVDGEQYHNLQPDSKRRPNKIVMNPPFSAAGTRGVGNSTKVGVRHLEQALEHLEDGGRLVAILGEGMGMDKSKFSDWWDKMMETYNVRVNIGIPGEEYRKYGTTFGNQLIIIDKTGPTPGTNVVEKLQHVRYGNVGSLEDALDAIAKIEQPNRGSDVARPAGDSSGSVRTASGQVGGTGKLPGTGKRSRSGSSGPKPAGPTASGEAVKDAVPQPEPQKPDGPRSSDDRIAATDSVGEPAKQPDVTPEEKPAPKKAEAAEEEEDSPDSGTFVPYKPAVKHGVKHPAKIVQTATMGSVHSPNVKYKPKLSKRALEVLSDIQIEAVSLAGQRRQIRLKDGSVSGMAIGMGTGFGKGATIAGIVDDAWNNGMRKFIWMSVSNDLQDAAQSDFKLIGRDDIPLKSISDWKADEPIDLAEGGVFTTYASFISSSKGNNASTRMQQLEDWIRDGGIIFLDEAHKAKNAEASGQGGKGSQTGEKLLVFQGDLPESQVIYVSATGFTEPRHMAYLTRMGLWGDGTPFDSFSSFAAAIDQGGLGAMEMISREMKARGMYVAGQLSMEGVEFDTAVHKLTPEQVKMYDAAAFAMQGVLQNIDQALGLTNADSRARAGALSLFFATQQRLFRMLTTAMKLPTAIKEIEKALKSGGAVVIGLESTAESRTAKKVSDAQKDGSDLDDLDFSPRELIADFVEKAFPTQQFEIVRDPKTGKDIKRPLQDKDGSAVQNKQAKEMRDKLIGELGRLHLPDNPLDQILEHFGHDRVAELSGRKKRLMWITNPETGKRERKYVQRNPKGVPSKKTNLHEMELFQGGKKDIAIITPAASTGISLHASNRVKNQKRRFQFTLEVPWSADQFLQKAGRTHRSDQASAPMYKFVATDVGGETRFTSSAARRLAQLGALAQGSRDASTGGISEFNVETMEGRTALARVYDHLMRGGEIEGVPDGRQLLRDMGILKKGGGSGEEIKDEDMRNITRFLNRLLAVDIKRQNSLWKYFEATFRATVEEAKAKGTFDLGTKEIRKGQRGVVSVKATADPITIATDEDSGAETTLYKVGVVKRAPRMSWHSVAAKLEDTEKKGMFWKNRNSGAISYFQFSSTETNAATGYLSEYYAQFTPQRGRSGRETREDIEARYERLSEKEAEPLWTEAYESAPQEMTEDLNIVAGTILPLWNKLMNSGGKSQVVLAVGDDSRRYVGVQVPTKAVNKLLRQMGKADGLASAKDVLQALNDGEELTLEKDLKLKKFKIRGEERIELQNVDYDMMEGVRKLGLIEENINYRNRFFVPTGANAEDVLGKILEKYPVDESGKEYQYEEADSRSAPSIGGPGKKIKTTFSEIHKPAGGKTGPYGHLKEFKPVGLPEMVELIEQITGKPPRVRKYTGERDGYVKFRQKDAEVFVNALKGANPEEALSLLGHEFGHVIDYGYKTLERGNVLGRILSLRKFLKQTFGDLNERVIRDELKRITQELRPFDISADAQYTKYRYQARELYADAISALVMSPDMLERWAPTFYRGFFDNLKTKPEAEKAYTDIQAMLNMPKEELLKHRDERYHRMTRKGRNRLEQKYKEAADLKKKRSTIRATVDWLRAAIDTKDIGVSRYEKKYKEMHGRDVALSDSPMVQLDENRWNSDDARLLYDTKTNIEDKLTAVGISTDEFGKMLYFGRVFDGDRQDRFNPLGHYSESAGEQIAYTRSKWSEEQNKVVDDALEYFRGLVEDWVADQYEAGVITDRKFKSYIENSKRYATFAVVDYLSTRMPGEVHAQVGTMKDIADPYLMTLAKILRSRESLRVASAKRKFANVVRALGRSEFVEADVESVDGEQKGKSKKYKPHPDYYTHYYMDRGELKAIYVDPIVELAFTGSSGDVNRLGDAMGWVTDHIFKPLWIGYNPAFLLVRNPARDIAETLKNNPDVGYAELVAAMNEGVRAAIELAKGNYGDELVRYASEAAGIPGSLESFWMGKRGESPDKVLLRRNGLSIPDEKRLHDLLLQSMKDVDSAQAVVGAIAKIMGGFEFAGAVSETSTKLAVASLLKNRGVSPKAAGHRLRNNVGTPNYRTKGKLAPVLNALHPFFTLWKEGLKRNYRSATSKTRARGFWTRTMVMDILPTVLKWAAVAGLFGIEWEKFYKRIPNYDKVGNHILPLPLVKMKDKKGREESVYLRLPRDETGAAMQKLTWSALELVSGDKAGSKAAVDQLGDVFSGQLPSSNPLFDITGAVWEYGIQGRLPIDEFTGAPLMTRDEFKLGGLPAWMKIGKYALRQTGIEGFKDGTIGRVFRHSAKGLDEEERRRKELEEIQSIKRKNARKGYESAFRAGDDTALDRAVESGVMDSRTRSRVKNSAVREGLY